MRRIFQLSVACLGAAVLSACSSPSEVTNVPIPPTAGVRFINAVPDSAGSYGLDFRFIDFVESNAQFRIPFRNSPSTSAGVTASTAIEYKAAKAGERKFRVFLSDSLGSVASTVIKDSTLTLEAGKNYSVVLWGFARTGSTPSMKLSVIEETVADPGANVALRVLNTTPSAIDVREYASTGTAPAAPTWAAVPGLSVSSYVTAPPGQFKYNVQPAGGGTPLFADALALIGTPGTIDIEALPGTTVAGSAVTLIVFPRSVAGSKTPQTSAFQVPAASFMWDRRPPITGKQ
ncbi:MAG: DUF4397 domain-containing protein [Gemmatimonadales bacterium]